MGEEFPPSNVCLKVPEIALLPGKSQRSGWVLVQPSSSSHSGVPPGYVTPGPASTKSKVAINDGRQLTIDGETLGQE